MKVETWLGDGKGRERERTENNAKRVVYKGRGELFSHGPPHPSFEAYRLAVTCFALQLHGLYCRAKLSPYPAIFLHFDFLFGTVVAPHSPVK